MENAEFNNATRWLENSLASVAPPVDWEPDTRTAHARFSARLESKSGRRRYWLLGLALASVAAIAIAASANGRALAQQCWQCIAGGGLELALRTKANAGIVPAHSRNAAPQFALKDAEGSLITLSGYRGKVVLLDFWATWCGGCKVEIPWYEEFADRYGKNGLAVVGVSMDDEGWKVVKPFVEQKQIRYQIVLGDDSTAKRYGVSAMPVTLLIDRSGNVAATHIGVVDKRLFENEIRLLLEEGTQEPKRSTAHQR
jgi:cytochrome c biogenesis protein CcmG/thiol:disulfide interchange protein DsbE